MLISDESPENSSARDLWGIRIPAILVALVGLEFFVLELLGLLLVSRSGHRIAGIGIVFCSAALTFLSWWTIKGLLHGVRLAGYTASSHGLLLLGFCAQIVYDLHILNAKVPTRGSAGS